MASGKPLVATKRKTHTQVLDDSTAFLAEATPLELGKAIYEALTNDEFAREKGNNAKANDIVSKIKQGLTLPQNNLKIG